MSGIACNFALWRYPFSKPRLSTLREQGIVSRPRAGDLSLYSHFGLLFLLNQLFALALYGVKRISFLEEGAPLAALASGFLLFTVNVLVPFAVFVLVRRSARQGKPFLFTAYGLSVLVGVLLTYGALTTISGP